MIVKRSQVRGHVPPASWREHVEFVNDGVNSVLLIKVLLNRVREQFIVSAQPPEQSAAHTPDVVSWIWFRVGSIDKSGEIEIVRQRCERWTPRCRH